MLPTHSTRHNVFLANVGRSPFFHLQILLEIYLDLVY